MNPIVRMKFRTAALKRSKTDPGGVTDGSQGVNLCDDLSAIKLTPGRAELVFSPRPSSAPVVTTASSTRNSSATPYGVGGIRRSSRGLRHPGYHLRPSGSGEGR